MLQKFNVDNCDIRTQLMFEEWATVPMYRILTLVLARKGKGVFSGRGIAEMIDIPKSTVYEALKILCNNGYLIKVGDRYNLMLGIDVQPTGQKDDESVQPTGQGCPAHRTDLSSLSDNSVQPTGHNNNKQIIKKNNDKEITAHTKPELKFYRDAKEHIDWEAEEEIGTGRRPLKKYPEIWITLVELAEAFEILDAKLPRDRWKDVFLRTRNFARDQAGTSHNYRRVRTASALTGWALKEAISMANEEAKLKRNLEARA